MDRIAPAPYTDVGAELRAAREARDLEIARVAQDLRIREDYLKALESSAFEGLPALPYVIGFVRSYAEYLQLDAEDLVQRFKAEVNAEPENRLLAFPEPVQYGHFPGATVILASLLLAAVLFGGWYFYGSERGDGGMIATRTSGDGAAKTAAANGADKTAAGVAGKIAADAAVKASGVKKPDRKLADATPKAAAKTESGDKNTSADAVPKEPPVGQSATTSGAPKASDDAKADPEKQPLQIAAVPKDDRIVLRATANAWVQIRDRDNRVVFVKVLRAGDSYTVPEREGLIMNVGNAGGLKIIVAGKEIKPLGPANIPVFNVSLDPQALLKHRR